MNYSLALALSLVMLVGCSKPTPPSPPVPMAPDSQANGAMRGTMLGDTAAAMEPIPGAPMASTNDQALREVDRLASRQAQMMEEANAPPKSASDKEALNIVVHKSPTCGCCKAWIKHLESDGFTVVAVDHENVNPVKDRLGVPADKRSCHTGEINGMFVEGHVPAADIRKMVKLNKNKKGLKGITVPGMPAGSPGMEMGDTKQPYDVVAVSASNEETVFASH